MDGVGPVARLLFWLRMPFVADVVLVPLGIGMIVAGRSGGWGLLVFTLVKSAINAAGLWLALRYTRGRRHGRDRSR